MKTHLSKTATIIPNTSTQDFKTFHVRTLVLSLMLGLILTSSFAQKTTDKNFHSWYMITATQRFNEHWGALTMFDYRQDGLANDWQQSVLRLGIDYYFTSGPQISAGYDWMRTLPDDSRNLPYVINENRAWEQLILKQKAGRFYFGHRYRMEQRFIQLKKMDIQNNCVDDGEVFRQRARYQFSVTVPINNKTVEPHTLFLTVADEIFIGFGNNAGTNLMQQNWLNAGLGYKFNPKLQLYAGYMDQYVFKPDGIHVESNNTMRLVLSLNLDWRHTDS